MDNKEAIKRIEDHIRVHALTEPRAVLIHVALRMAINALEQPEIIRCKDCKHWNLQVGNVKGDGLGSCDFHNVNLVTGEGFCYWADMRGEAE